MHNKAVVII